MMSRILALPLFVILLGIASASMIVPAIHAFATGDEKIGRVFLVGSILFLTITAMVGLATANYKPKSTARSHLLALMATFTVLPVILAFPFVEVVRSTSLLSGYFEMVSSLTTTGATLFDDPASLPNTIHLWRALVGWMGGFLVWVTAIAILAPMNLGGFEVTSRAIAGQSHAFSQIDRIANPSERLSRYAIKLFPIYSGLTLLLWIALILTGEVPFIAINHAMSTLATSGISPVGGLDGNSAGRDVELLIFIFLFFGLSRMTFSPDVRGSGISALVKDPEMRMGTALLVVVPLLLFLRHWFGALEINEVGNFTAALQSLWGSTFMVLSFLTTTGFVSTDWEMAMNWSALPTPGLILLGLALVGGGVATTAGGVKLLRVYALYKHGLRELDRLAHPSSVGGAGAEARRIRRQGAYIAWIFFMLFALSLTVIMLALAATGLDFETSMVLGVASLSTTGPLAQIAGEVPISYASLGDGSKIVLIGAMILGRLETLAIIALLNPDFWR